MIDLDKLRKQIRRNLKSAVYLQDGVCDPERLQDDTSVSFSAFSRLKCPQAIAIAQEEVGLMPAQFLDKKPDEDQTSYDRKLIIWQAERDSRRAEARADKRAVLRGGIACVAAAFLEAWVIGVLAFFGFEHVGLTVPAIITGIILLVGAFVLFIKHDGMLVPE